MKRFWKFLLRKSLPSDSLKNVIFGVIGLGDSSYQKFNFVAKRLHKRLLQLGGSAILSAALCDDQHDLGIGGVLYPWMSSFWARSNELFPLPIGISPLPKSAKTTRWNVKKIETEPVEGEMYGDFEESSSDTFTTVIVSIKFYCIILL